VVRRGAASSATGIGNTLTLTLNIAFSASFAGNKVIYTAARDVAQNNSGWFPSGVWQVPGAAGTTTTAVTGITPGSGTTNSQQFTITFTDTRGYQDIGVVNMLVNDYLDGGNACYIAYSQPANALYLVNDAAPACWGASCRAPGPSRTVNARLPPRAPRPASAATH
jgi:hypothetical protein